MVEERPKARHSYCRFKWEKSFVKAALKDREFMIHDLTDAKTLAHLFKYDSVFGKFDGTVEIGDDNSALVINGLPLKVISEKDPSRLPWKDLNIDIVPESSGIFNDAKDGKKHIEAVYAFFSERHTRKRRQSPQFFSGQGSMCEY